MVLEALAVLLAAFSISPTEVTLMAYDIGISDLPPRDVAAACKRAIRECKFCPRPAELRALCGANNPEADGAGAWERIIWAASRHGSYRTVAFSDGTANESIRVMGGWPTLLDQLDAGEREKWARKEFLGHYLALRRSGQESGEPLQGLAETGRVVAIQCNRTTGDTHERITRRDVATARLARPSS